MTTQPTHAVIVGGSIAGMLNARILSRYFDQITIVERDTLPDSPDFRTGAPQGRHVHALLAQGQQLMEAMFPGLADDFREIGAPRFTWGKDAAYLTPGGWMKRFDTGVVTNIVSRVALEYLIRRRLTQLCSNVTIVQQTDVVQLLAEGDTVTGVRIQSRESKVEQTLDADLVIDSSGRNSKVVEWLQALGYDAPEETQITSYIGYATRWYEMPENAPDWRLMFIVGRPAEGLKRGGGIFEVEGNRWMVTLGGMNKDYPPTDEAGFLEYAQTLATPALYEAIKNATPTSPVYGYRIPGNRLRHFERLTRCPENFIVTGDAVCAFNPLYGQGMTVAAMEAQMLDGLMQVQNVRQMRGFAEKFYKALPKTISNAWLMATGEDLRYEGTEGDRPNAMVRFVQTYMDQVFKYTLDDEDIVRRVIEVSNLTAAPTSLFAPRVVWTLLRKRFFTRQPQDDYVNTAVIPAMQQS